MGILNRILRALRLAPLSECRRLEAALGLVEHRLWLRYENRLKNDISMSLSWFYTQHVHNVSLGIPETQAAGMWPYYPKAVLLSSKPCFGPETLDGGLNKLN